MKFKEEISKWWTIFLERIWRGFSLHFSEKWANESLGPNFQRMRSLYTRSTNGPLVFNLLAHSKCKAQSLISQGPYGDMSSNDMSCDDVSPSDTSSGATSSFSIKWHVWYNRYYISILSSSLMKCHQMTCHHLPRHHTCHVITWHVINDDKLKPVHIPVV